MTSRSGRGRWERVLAARRQAGEALGRGSVTESAYGAPKRKAGLPPPAAPTLGSLDPSERSEMVLSLGEAAVRLGVSRAELESMIDACTIEALPTGFTRTITAREIERLTRT